MSTDWHLKSCKLRGLCCWCTSSTPASQGEARQATEESQGKQPSPNVAVLDLVREGYAVIHPSHASSLFPHLRESHLHKRGHASGQKLARTSAACLGWLGAEARELSWGCQQNRLSSGRLACQRMRAEISCELVTVMLPFDLRRDCCAKLQPHHGRWYLATAISPVAVQSTLLSLWAPGASPVGAPSSLPRPPRRHHRPGRNRGDTPGHAASPGQGGSLSKTAGRSCSAPYGKARLLQAIGGQFSLGPLAPCKLQRSTSAPACHG